jgi:hypothetical protein
MVEEDDDPMGECDTGYQNVLCADCEYDYSRSGTIPQSFHADIV